MWNKANWGWTHLSHMWRCEKCQSRSSSHVTLFHLIYNSQSYVKLWNSDASTQISWDLKSQYCVKVSSSHVTLLFLHIQISVPMLRIRYVKSQNSNVKKHFTWFHAPCFFFSTWGNVYVFPAPLDISPHVTCNGFFLLAFTHPEKFLWGWMLSLSMPCFTFIQLDTFTAGSCSHSRTLSLLATEQLHWSI